MKEFKNILVPVDGSKLSQIAFKKALSMSEMVDSNVDIVFVSGYPTGGPVGMEQPPRIDPQPDLSGIFEPYEKIARENDIKIGKELERGIASERIIEMSKSYDLIIMGTRGRNPIASLILGSVAENVARKACCPVMLIREKSHECKK